jgi:poly(3-hydroxybutyrate) depolymerase
MFCRTHGLEAGARAHAEAALAVESGNVAAKELLAALGPAPAPDPDPGAAPPAATPALSKSDQKTFDAAKKKLATLYRELAFEKHAGSEQARFDGYIVRAYALDPKVGGPALEAEWKGAYGKKDWARAHRLLSGAEAVTSDPARAKALKEVELKAAETAPLKKKATTHPMEYYVLLPKGWSPQKKWPILVGIDGAGCNWLGMLHSVADARKDAPFIIISPITTTNTNDLAAVRGSYTYPQSVFDEIERNGRKIWDEEGLIAVVDDVRRDFSGEEKLFITGFSGGGNLTWQMVFAHPEMLAAAAPGSGNFSGLAGGVSEHPARETLPIKAFQGENDPYRPTMLDGQWERAQALLEENGYKSWERILVPGAGHSACLDKVMEFFKSIHEKSKGKQ